MTTPAKPVVAVAPTGGQGLALDLKGNVPVRVRAKLPGYEFGYTEITAPVSPTATTEATANTVVTAPAVVFDGATSVWVEFFVPLAEPDRAAAGRNIIFVLYDGSSSIGLFGAVVTPAAAEAGAPANLRRKLTPSTGSHTYSVRAYVSAGTGSIVVGTGVLGDWQPGYIRVVKA